LRSTRAEIRFCPEKDKLIGILRQAALYIGHDSGITHLAAMLGAPTVALFKGSNADQWSPLGPDVRVIQDNNPAFSTLLPPSLPQERDTRRSGPARRDPTMISKDMRLVV